MIVFGRDRDQALRRAKRVLDEFILDGVITTIPFHKKVIAHPDFISGSYDTNFVEAKVLN